MGIDLLKLENSHKRGNKIIARCPACAEIGQDKKGNHLFINEGGRFGCIVYQGSDGHDHRKRIFQLVGEGEPIKIAIDVKQVSQASQKQDVVLMKDVLGQLGHHF